MDDLFKFPRFSIVLIQFCWEFGDDNCVCLLFALFFSPMIDLRSLAEIQPLTNMLCGMTMICCWFLFKFGCKEAGRMVIVLDGARVLLVFTVVVSIILFLFCLI